MPEKNVNNRVSEEVVIFVQAGIQSEAVIPACLCPMFGYPESVFRSQTSVLPRFRTFQTLGVLFIAEEQNERLDPVAFVRKKMNAGSWGRCNRCNRCNGWIVFPVLNLNSKAFPRPFLIAVA